jgi:hypothetical protein
MEVSDQLHDRFNIGCPSNEGLDEPHIQSGNRRREKSMYPPGIEPLNSKLVNWVDFRLLSYRICPSSNILRTRKHNVSETVSVSVFRWGGRHLLCWIHYKELTLITGNPMLKSELELELELIYDWRFTANQFALATSPLRSTTKIFIFQLNTWGYIPYVTSSLTRRWVRRLQLLLGRASAVILRSDSRGTHDHILLSQIRDSSNLEGHVPVFISPGTVWSGYTPRHWVPFSSLPTTRRAMVEVYVT